ncbi:MAG: hypothetical protein ACOX8H_05535 [Ruminococcus sp.]|jgi:hypothetical protein
MQDFKNKIKKGGKTALFFLILMTILTGLSIFVTEISKKNDKLIQGRNKSLIQIQQEPENSIDLLILGDSLSYTALSPMQMWRDYGITSFIGGQSGQKIHETYYMLKTALETQSPKLVVIETDVLLHSRTGLGRIREKIEEKLSFYFPVFRYHNIWKPLLMGTEYAEESYKGFMLRDTIQAYKKGEYMKETADKVTLSPVVTEYMDKIINLCSENDIQILLVSTPSPVNYNFKKYNALKEYAKENNLKYLDMNLKVKKLGINWESDTLDKGDHLNLLGAQKITGYFGDYLKSRYNLLDHRKDKKYEMWNRDAEDYEKKLEKKIEMMQKSLRNI